MYTRTDTKICNEYHYNIILFIVDKQDTWYVSNITSHNSIPKYRHGNKTQ